MKRLAVLFLAAVLLLSGCGGQGTSGHPGSSGSASASPASPLGVASIFGLSVALPAAAEALTAQADTLRSWRVPLIRLEFAGPVPADTLTAALSAVRAAGARPIVAVPNTGVDPTALVGQVRRVFTDGVVYFEYADHETWNRVAPQLRRDDQVKLIARVDPADPGNVGGFVSFAVPRPDFLSWSQFACQPGDPDSACLADPGTWHTSVDHVSSAVRAAIGVRIPVFFSEWNLDQSADPRYRREKFITPWTRQALTSLFSMVPSGLAGAMITAPAGGSLGLIDDGHITAQGAVFRDMLSVASPTPSAPVPSVPVHPGSSGEPVGRPSTGSTHTQPASHPPVKTHISFEKGTDNWVKYWGNEHITTLARVTSQHYDGSGALRMSTNTVGDLAIGCSHGLTGLHAGSVVVYHIWTDGKARGNVAGFVQDSSRKAYFPRAPMAIPAKAGWFTFTFTVPQMTPFAIGLQLSPTKAGATVMLDGVGWSS